MNIEDILVLYGQLLNSVDDWFGRCVSMAPQNIHCAKGCSSCCRGLFDITMLDACYLKHGFDFLEPQVKHMVTKKAEARLAAVRELWPDFAPPFTLNGREDSEWDGIMPDDDETPCVLLDNRGQCLLYQYRPMTCRLHGLPLIDIDGEVLDSDGCSLNPSMKDLVSLPGLRFEFLRLFQDELMLFRMLMERLLKLRLNELDTLIPAAMLLSFDEEHWLKWAGPIKRQALKINHGTVS